MMTEPTPTVPSTQKKSRVMGDYNAQRVNTEFSTKSNNKNRVDLKLTQNEIDLLDDIKERMMT